MRWCKKCLEPDTRPDCQFDDEGVCLPCRVYENMEEIDWPARQRELSEIVSWAKSRKERNQSGYDAIIPVSGGKDSTRQALYARDELGLKALLVSLSYPPEQLTERGANNMANLIGLGFDTFVVRPSPETWRRLMKIGFTKYGNWCKSTEIALYASAPKVAVQYNIPLLIYGENPALQWGSSGGSLDGDANRLKYCNTMDGGDISGFYEEGYSARDMFWHCYPSDDLIERSSLRMIYLGYYIDDFNDVTNGRIAMDNGLEPRTGDDAILEDIGQMTVYDALDDDFVIVNQMLKYLKYGFGKASETLSGMVRTGDIPRDEAIKLAYRLDGKCAPRYIERFCRYLEISEDEFWDVAESFRSPDVWEQKDGAWAMKVPLK